MSERPAAQSIVPCASRRAYRCDARRLTVTPPRLRACGTSEENASLPPVDTAYSKQDRCENKSIRPVSAAGRVLTGTTRPGSASRQSTTANTDGRRSAISRATGTALGRTARLVTASLGPHPSGLFVDFDVVDIKKYGLRPILSRALFEFAFHVCKRYRKALELAILAAETQNYQDWWWKAQIGQCYSCLGQLRDADRQFKSALAVEPGIAEACLRLSRAYLQRNQPRKALEQLKSGLRASRDQIRLLLEVAHIYEQTEDLEEADRTYKQVLVLEPVNTEALASIANHYFYTERPESAIKFYRRLIYLGHSSPEIYNNLGTCAYYAQLFDSTLKYFKKAFAVSSNDTDTADVWFNLGQVAVGTGNFCLAERCYSLAVKSSGGNHPEAYNNVAALLHGGSDVDSARASLEAASKYGSHLYEPFYNLAKLEFGNGSYQAALKHCNRALALYPENNGAKSLMQELRAIFYAGC